jgi:hypothetical protein
VSEQQEFGLGPFDGEFARRVAEARGPSDGPDRRAVSVQIGSRPVRRRWCAPPGARDLTSTTVAAPPGPPPAPQGTAPIAAICAAVPGPRFAADGTHTGRREHEYPDPHSGPWPDRRVPGRRHVFEV